MDRIKTVNLDREFRQIGAEVTAAASMVLSSGQYISGANVLSFEDSLADYCGTNYAVAVANGTDAIRIAVLAAGIRKGATINIPDFTFAATAEAPISAGYKVRCVPVYGDSFQMSTVYEHSIVVDLFGAIKWHDSISYPYVVIEDAAQAIGARSSNGFGLCSKSDAATISFYPTKTLGACGDAGAIVTNDRHIAAEARLLRDHHMSEKYIHSGCGFNSRMDEVQAAILLVKLKYIDEWIERKREIAKTYISGLSDLKLKVELPKEIGNERHTYHQFTIRVDCREKLRRFLSSKGIDTSVFYPAPISSMKGLVGNEETTIQSTARLCASVLSLPICAHLTNKEVDTVIMAVQEFYSNEKFAC